MNPANLSRQRADLVRIYAAAVAAVAPERMVEQALTGALDARIPAVVAAAGRVYLLAVGKAAVRMAIAAQRIIGAKVAATLIVTVAPAPEGTVGDATVMVGAHPLPDDTSLAAGQAALEFVARAGADDAVVLLLSGGASALMTAPEPGITLTNKIATTAALMRAGASIAELNTVRKHLSAVKGGGLLRALRGNASFMTLALSDVPGNDLTTIGSGPAVADPTTFAEAIAVLKRRRLWGRTPEAVRDRLERGAAHEVAETVKPGDPVLARSLGVVIGDNAAACAGAAAAARAAGYEVEDADSLSGPAARVCANLASRLASLAAGEPGAKGQCLIAGGEPLVEVRGAGKGGRAQHCALMVAIELARHKPQRSLCALFAGTDGIDGPTDAAGAIIASNTVSRALETGLDPKAALANNDSHTLFQALGDLLITGPTGTNVTDIFVALLATGSDRSGA